MFGRITSGKKIVVVADIGSGSAGVAYLAIHKEGPASVIAASRVSLPFEERAQSATAKAIIASVIDAGTKASTDYAASPYKNARVSSVYGIINAPWTRSNTLFVSSRLEKETRISNPMIAELAQKAIASDTTLDKDRLIESSVIRVELNGYPTGAPVGKSAHEISVAALLSDCDEEIQSGVKDALAKLFPGTKPTLRSDSRALISGMRALSDIGKDYVILVIAQETTSVLVVRGGLATDHVLIPEGVHSILKRISEKSLPEETLSLIRMVERDECSGDACDAMNASLARVEIDLARVYGEGLTKIAVPLRLPPDLVLVTHADLSIWLTKFFSRIDFTQCTTTAQPFSVHTLDPKSLKTLIASEGTAVADVELSIAGALVNGEEQA